MTDTHLSDVRFDELDLPSVVLEGLNDLGYSHCTSIQAEALPVALAGGDVAGQAQTGTGKTAAFLLAIFNQLLKNAPEAEQRSHHPRAMVLAPTRELAIQIHKDAESLGKHTGLKLGLVYGGTGYEQQREILEKGVDILIGTPGRLIDYFKQDIFNLKELEVMVLDEADRMFDLGFINDIRYLFRRMPPPEKRLSMLFSATLSHRVKELAYEHMNSPTSIKIESENVTADKVRQVLYHPANDEKLALLLGLLNKYQPSRTIVFVNTKRVAERLKSSLDGNDWPAAMLSGDVPQSQRQRLLREFQEGKWPILLATDVAARGLHIPDVTHVVNYDLPQSEEDYVHRIGRTARAGATGDAISFACEDYAFSLPDIEEYLGYSIPGEAITDDLLQKNIKHVAHVSKKKPAPKTGNKSNQAKGGNTSANKQKTNNRSKQASSHSKPAQSNGGRSSSQRQGKHANQKASHPPQRPQQSAKPKVAPKPAPQPSRLQRIISVFKRK